jgi:Flp pilus assembly protein TadD
MLYGPDIKTRGNGLKRGRVMDRMKWVALCVAALAVAGCQTSAVDTLETTAIAPATKDISAQDLASGKAQFRDANYGLAEKHFRKAVELRADNAEAWMGLAASYDQLGRFDFADRAYDQLLKIAGRQPRIINNLGYSKLLRGDKKSARKLLMEAKAAMPADMVVEANLALLAKG